MKAIKFELIEAIDRTIQKLKNGHHYEWGHMGSCNCGNLAQELTPLSRAEIHRYAMERSGDWNDQILEFCPNSGYPIDWILEQMQSYGLTLQDLSHLERLSSPEVLQVIPLEIRNQLHKNRKEDLLVYLAAWKEVLTDRWEKQQEIEIEKKQKKNSLALKHELIF